MSARPDGDLIIAINACENGARCAAMLASEGITEVIQSVLEQIFEFQDSVERAYMIEYCIRHGGVTRENFMRFTNLQQTNKCSICRQKGHDKNHCPGKLFG